jgi:hypothetical protein
MRGWRFIRRMGWLGGPVKDVDESVSRSEGRARRGGMLRENRTAVKALFPLVRMPL